MNKNLKIGIVGLGLIGGSIFKAFCALKCNVFGVSKSVETIEQAKQYSDNVSKSLESLQDCDVIFVCTPMHKTLSILDKLESIVSEKTIVADVASLKRFLCKKNDHMCLSRPIRWLGQSLADFIILLNPSLSEPSGF